MAIFLIGTERVSAVPADRLAVRSRRQPDGGYTRTSHAFTEFDDWCGGVGGRTADRGRGRDGDGPCRGAGDATAARARADKLIELIPARTGPCRPPDRSSGWDDGLCAAAVTPIPIPWNRGNGPALDKLLTSVYRREEAVGTARGASGSHVALRRTTSMSTRRQIEANRSNSSRSTGPRSAAGLARASRNACKVGLFSKLLVISALGESQVEHDVFRRAIVADLNPVGALECELADRVAGLMWRLRRVTRYESAAMAAAVGELPPHPDTVEPLPGDGVCFPVPEGASTAFRLAHLRARMTGGPATLAAYRAAAGALAARADARSPVDLATACRVLDAAAGELGWFTIPDPWSKVLATAGLKPQRVSEIQWTAGRLRRVLAHAARGGGACRRRVSREPSPAASARRRGVGTTPGREPRRGVSTRRGTAPGT